MYRAFPLICAVLVLLSAALGACTPSPPPPAILPPVSQAGWNPSDLRWIGPGDAGNPQQDLIAAYARSTGEELQIRLDFLEFQSVPPFDIYLVLDHTAGGEYELPVSGKSDIQWDELLIFTQETGPLLVTGDQQPVETGEAVLSIEEDLEALVLHLNARFLIPGTTFQIFLTPSRSTQLIDATPPLDLNGTPPAPAPLLLAFWDTFPAATPAQAMRRWNGAHTGPLGQRHGLFQLLKASDQYDMPLVLLDLKNPASLAALSTMGHIEWIQSLEARGLLTLPDAAAGDPETAVYSLELSRQAGSIYGFNPSAFVYAPIKGSLPTGYQAGFLSTGDERIIQTPNGRLIPLPGLLFPEEGAEIQSGEQVNRSGLTLYAKRKLLDTALSNDPARLAVMGGSLPDSLWADSSIASLAFSYLANHPWIQPLNQEALLGMQAVPGNQVNPQPACSDLLCTPLVLPFTPYTSSGVPVSSGITLPDLRQLIRAELDASPPGAAADLAWQMYLQLTAPSANPYRQALQANYLGQVGHLLFIARWAANPAPVSDCTLDLDWDGTPECVLTSDRFIATFEIDGGRMLFAGMTQDGDWLQMIGPTSQLQVGAGEPQEWQIQRGTAADPLEIPGAFAIQDAPFSSHPYDLQPDALTFRTDSGSEKTYRLKENGFNFTYRSPQAFSTRLPLLFSPDRYRSPDRPGEYTARLAEDQRTFSWGWDAGPRIIVTASTGLNPTSYQDSIEWLHQPEDPERAYPPGHFLPFPMAVLSIRSEGELSVDVLLE